MKKKILLRIGLGVLIGLVLAVLVAGLFLDRAVKLGVETIGSRLTQVDVRLAGVNLSLLSGSGQLKGLVVGNPKGYKTPDAASFGSVAVAVAPGSLLSKKIVVRSVTVRNPEITFEGGFGGNNLSQILKNVRGSSAASTNAPSAGEASQSGRTFEVDNLLITGAKLQVSVTGMGGKSVTVPLGDIQLSNLGTGPDGITAGDLTERLVAAIERKAVAAADHAVARWGKGATGAEKNLQKDVGSGVSNVTKKLGNWFKKK